MIKKKIYSIINITIFAIIFLAISIYSNNIQYKNIHISTIKASSPEIQSESDNYKILDATIDSGGGTSETGSGSFGMLSSIGNPTSDSRLQSASYALGSGFPNGIQANVPIIKCAETDTIGAPGSEDCSFPNNNGAQGECGEPGCYDRGKFEIDHQDNPIDTLYLVSINDGTTDYYLKNDFSLDPTTTPTIANHYMTICELHGEDSRDTSCTANPTAQSANVRNLLANTTYTIKARAISGDFTQTEWSQTSTMTTKQPTLYLDLDIDPSTSPPVTDDPAPYSINIGKLFPNTVTTATDRIWLEMSTNLPEGLSTYIKDTNAALIKGADTIPSETEDLSTDPNNNGGYGLKIASVSPDTLGTNLGPIFTSNYNTAGTDEVGSLTTTSQLIFYTDENSPTSRGPLIEGNASLYVKATTITEKPTGQYTDTITFSMISNY